MPRRVLNLDLGEGVVQVLEQLADGVMTSIHGRWPPEHLIDGIAPGHLGVTCLHHRFDLSAVEGLDSAFESLDVLLGRRYSESPAASRAWLRSM
jgi:hypothetical protein